MSARRVEAEISAPHPRETFELFGHREAETALLNAYKSGRIPHAWLIGGAQGIGKATLAYRMARFVLTHRNPLARRFNGQPRCLSIRTMPARDTLQRAPMAAS